MKKLLIRINTVLIAAFLLSAAVQYNDPDPFRWILMYGAAALVCLLALREEFHWIIPAALAIISAVWAATLSPALGQVSSGEVFVSFHMKSIAVEQVREMGGLLIITVWMMILTVAAKNWAAPVESNQGHR